jgi:hydrogenase maturation factor
MVRSGFWFCFLFVSIEKCIVFPDHDFAKVQREIERAVQLFLNLRASKYIEFHVSCDVD